MVKNYDGFYIFLQKEFKDTFKRGLASLPVPKNDFEIVMPEPEEEATEDDTESIFIPDQADLDNRREAQLKAESKSILVSCLLMHQ